VLVAASREVAESLRSRLGTRVDVSLDLDDTDDRASKPGREEAFL
jgi:hypothetical protein